MIEITNANFENEVVNSDIPVLMDFWSPQCMPCKMLMPVIEGLENSYKGKLKFVKINVLENEEIASRYGVSGIPNVTLTMRGEKIDSFTGFAPEGMIKAKIDFMTARL